LNVGAYQFTRPGLTDNLVEQTPLHLTGGKLDNIHMNLVQGQSMLLVEASDEGVALLLADMVSNFVTWSSQHVCDTFGFKNFGLPLSVSDCEMDTEDTEKYRVTIRVPWMMESFWTLKEDALGLKEFFLQLNAS